MVPQKPPLNAAPKEKKQSREKKCAAKLPRNGALSYLASEPGIYA